MSVLSLTGAAERAGVSKVDVWRAIREGWLSARKTDDGGYVVDTEDLFRVFQTKRQDPILAEPDLTGAPEAAEGTQRGESAETVASDDVAVAFAALQVELKNLLGPLAATIPADDPRRDSAHAETPDLTEQNVRLAAELAAERARAGKAISEYAALADQLVALAEAHRPWWRRLLG